MHFYAFYCEDAPNSSEKRKSVRPAHLSRLKQLATENRLLLAGPLLNTDHNDDIPAPADGSLVVAKFNNLSEAIEWIAADPYVTAEVFARVTTKPFTPVLPETNK